MPVIAFVIVAFVAINLLKTSRIDGKDKKPIENDMSRPVNQRPPVGSAGNTKPVPNTGTAFNAGTAANTGMAANTGTATVRPNVNNMPGHGHVACQTDVLYNRQSSFDESKHPRLDAEQGIIAMRYDTWQSVPHNTRIVRCCYCGALNGVSARGNSVYKCYFCWRKL